MRTSRVNGHDKGRLNLVLSKSSLERLNRLREKTEASSNADVFKDALRLYEALVEDAEAGKEFLTKDEGGNVTSYRIFLGP